MSRWYRAYEGTVTDAKLAEAAMVADVSRAVSIAAWHCLLESAATVNNCGSYDTTSRRVSVILFEPPAAIEALFAAYAEMGLIGDGAVLSWKKRQFHSDDSKERVAKHRAKKRENDDVTPSNGGVTPPYTETDTKTEKGETTVSPRTGARLPDDWEPRAFGSDTVAGQIVAARGHEWAARALESFRNHWRSANGPNARKRDWQAACANWIIEQDNRDGRRSGSNITSLRGTRPDPALDLLRAARAAENREADRGTGSALPAIGSG